MADLKREQQSQPVKIAGGDESHFVDVIDDGGQKKMRVTGDFVANIEQLGDDNIADAWFEITQAGAATDTVRIQIAVGAHDPSTPDRDVPAVDVTTTLGAGEAGDELALRDLIISDLNGDSNFQQGWKATAVKDNAVIHISSLFTAEFGERLTAGDFAVTPSGTTTTVIFDDVIKRRRKKISLARDPSDRRVGVVGISGDVEVTPGALTDRFFQPAILSGSDDLRVNGSVTPQEFTVDADATSSLFVEELRFVAIANGIKYDQFLNQNVPLTTGINVHIQSSEQVFSFQTIKATEDFLALFTIPPESFRFEKQAGADIMVGSFQLVNPFEIKKAGSFTTDDHIKVTINDDLTFSGLKTFRFFAIGFKKEV